MATVPGGTLGRFWRCCAKATVVDWREEAEKQGFSKNVWALFWYLWWSELGQLAFQESGGKRWKGSAWKRLSNVNRGSTPKQVATGHNLCTCSVMWRVQKQCGLVGSVRAVFANLDLAETGSNWVKHLVHVTLCGSFIHSCYKKRQHSCYFQMRPQSGSYMQTLDQRSLMIRSLSGVSDEKIKSFGNLCALKLFSGHRESHRHLNI